MTAPMAARATAITSGCAIGLAGSTSSGVSAAGATVCQRYTNGALAAVHGGSRAGQLAADYGVPAIERYDDVLASPEIDAVLVATPQMLHLDQVSLAARAGKHVLVEKPMGLNRADCEQMVDVCCESGVTLSVIQTWRFRGTVDRPGLMMGLDRGGACRGVVQRLVGSDIEERLGLLARREASSKPMTQAPRWVTVETARGKQRAIAICIIRSGPAYCRGTPDEIADVIAHACGHWGSCAEYLMNTVRHLEALGIHDRYLWRLQELVAARIKARG